MINRSISVAVLGASKNPERYSNMAVDQLHQRGYLVYPVNPVYDTVAGLPCYDRLTDINDEIDVLTIYMNPQNLLSLQSHILLKKPKRIIFNPGSMSQRICNECVQAGIEVLEACTLVLLRTGQFYTKPGVS
jgi:predicted CoA-binding protein